MMKQASTSSAKQFNSPSGLFESINTSLRSPAANQSLSMKRKEQPTNSSQGHISSVRTQLSLEKKKVQDLNKCVMDYKSLKQNSEQKLNDNIEELRYYKEELQKSQKENKNYQYKLEYLEKEKARLENQNKQLKSYINKLEAQLKTASQRRASTNSPFNRTSTSAANINTFTNENFNTNPNNPQHNISSQNLNVSNISQSNTPNTQLAQYVKKLENDVKNYQQEIKILTNALEINTPKVSIKRGLDQSAQQQYEKNIINLTKELAEFKEIIQQNEDVEVGLRDKIQNLNQELEKAIIQIEENKIIKDNDNDEIFKLENENKSLKEQIADSQQQQQILQNQLNQSINQNQQLRQSQQSLQLPNNLSNQLNQVTDRLNTPKQQTTDRQNTPKQSITEMKLQSSFQQNQTQSNDPRNIQNVSSHQHNQSQQSHYNQSQQNYHSPHNQSHHNQSHQNQNHHNQSQNSHHSQQSHSFHDKQDAFDIIQQQKETIRELTEQISQTKGQLTEQNLNQYSDQQRWNKQMEDLRDTLRTKTDGHQDLQHKIKELQFEVESLKKKIVESKDKKNKFKQEIHILKQDQKQLDELNKKLNNKLKQIIEDSSGFKDQIFSSLRLNNKNYQAPRSSDAILQEILYLQQENKQMKQVVDESVNKYAQQALLNQDLKNEIRSIESMIERQTESKSLVQSTLASQIYNLRCQNTDLQEVNSTIRRECAMFMESLKPKSKRTKKSKSKNRTKSASAKKH